MRISDWSSDVCSSDLGTARIFLHGGVPPNRARRIERRGAGIVRVEGTYDDAVAAALAAAKAGDGILVADTTNEPDDPVVADVVRGYGVVASEIRSEEHTSELQSLMRISYAVFCLKKKQTNNHTNEHE